jgi:hypothetical protein
MPKLDSLLYVLQSFFILPLLGEWIWFALQFYVDTVKQMALRQLVAGSPLRTLCLLIAGKPAEVFSSDCSNSGDPSTFNMPQHPAQVILVGKTNKSCNDAQRMQFICFLTFVLIVSKVMVFNSTWKLIPLLLLYNFSLDLVACSMIGRRTWL